VRAHLVTILWGHAICSTPKSLRKPRKFRSSQVAGAQL